MGRTCNTYGGKRVAQRISVGALEGRKPLGRLEDNIKMDLREVGWDAWNWIDLVEDRDRWRVLVNSVMNLRVLQNAKYFLSSLGCVRFSGRTVRHAVNQLVFPQRDLPSFFRIYSTFCKLASGKASLNKHDTKNSVLKVLRRTYPSFLLFILFCTSFTYVFFVTISIFRNFQ